MKKENNGYTHRGIGVAIQNAVVAALHPTGNEIPQKRLARLRGYAIAVLEPLRIHLSEEELLRPEELVVVLLAAALVVHDQDTPKDPAPEKGLSAEALQAVEALYGGRL